MLAIDHCLMCNKKMMFPIGSYIDKVNILTFTKVFIAIFARVDCCCRHTCFAEIVLASFCSVTFVIAESNNLYSWYMRPSFYCIMTTHAQSYKSYTYNFHFGRRKIEGTFLSFRTLRDFSYFLPVFYFIFPVILSLY